MKVAVQDVKRKGSTNSKAAPGSAKGKDVEGSRDADRSSAYEKSFRDGQTGRYNYRTGLEELNAVGGDAVTMKSYAASPGKQTQRKAKSSAISRSVTAPGSRESVPVPIVSLNQIPKKIDDSAVLSFLSKKDINWAYINTIKALAGINYKAISGWLNIDIKTLSKLKNPDYKFKPDDKEKVLLLMILFKHGISAFGSAEKFKQWLFSENFYYGKKQPGSFLNTGTGIRFVDANLTAMEYGDNA